MESLVKGLINVALGHEDDQEERRNSPPRDERSRSTWAEVVSEEHDDEEPSSERRQAYGRNQPNKEEDNDGRTNVWGSRPPSQPHKTVEDESCWNKKGEEGNNDGWKTVGKKPSKQSHKVQKNQWNNFKRPASEQEFSEEVSDGVNFNPSEEELNDLSKACEKLWELDLNRLLPGKDYEIDVGEGKKVYQKHDMAEGTLFSWLNEDVFTKPTISRFCSLLDNYNPQAGCKEVVTNQELQEQSAFIEEISRTAPIKYLHKYLSCKGVVSEDYHDFKRFLSGFWFDLYGRGGTYGSSSAFEHVFVGELKNCGEQQVSGFHNWLQFYMEEAKGRVDYQGYIFPRIRGEIPDTETQLLTIQFEWNGVLKSVSSTLVGVSPEFEIALYTLCYYMGGEENFVQLGPYSVNIKCYRLGNKIGTAYPIAEC